METEILEQQTAADGGISCPTQADAEKITELSVEKDEEIDALETQLQESSKRLLDLTLALSEAEIKLALLMAGVAKEKLDSAAALTEVLCKAGKSPEDAAAEIVAEYPHLRAVQHNIPQFSAASYGTEDGFSAVRKIFSVK